MNLLITGAWSDAADYVSELEKMHHVVRLLKNEGEPLPCSYEWVEGVVCNGLFLHHKIERFTDLRYIQLTSAGYDRVPMDYVRQHNIEIHNARSVYSVPMAEFAICGVLQIYKQGRFFFRNQKEHRWEKHRGLRELNGKTVCIIGCGSVGRECAKRFRAFGCSVIGVNRHAYESEWFSKVFTIEQLDNVLNKADVVILALPLTEQTYHLINMDRLVQMKPDAVLVNISRGGVADTDALIEVVKERPSFSAVLDVFEEEPLELCSPLWDFPNTLLFPHNSFVGEGNKKRLAEVILANLVG